MRTFFTWAALLLSLFTASAAATVNYVPNSGFEQGVGRGWMSQNTSDDFESGNDREFRGHLTNDAHSGRYSLVAKGVTYSRAMILTGGTKTLKMWMKCDTAGAGPFYFGVCASQDLYTLPLTGTTNVAGSWTEYTLTVTIPSNGVYHVAFYTFQSNHDFLVDDIQLEDGSTSTTYTPKVDVEVGLSTVNTNRLYFSGDTLTANLHWFNAGAAQSVRYQYTVYDMYNTAIVTVNGGAALAAATYTDTTILLPSRAGWFRVALRLLDFNDAGDEMDYEVFPYTATYANTTPHATNDWVGGHGHASLHHVQMEKQKNRKFTRLLSPNYKVSRWDYLEPTRGAAYAWNDALITNYTYQRMNLVIPLTPTDTTWPTWATNADGTADMMAWSNYVNKVVTHVLALAGDATIYFEFGPNEPLQSGTTSGLPNYDSTGDHHAGGTNKPINVQVATNYTKCMEFGIAGATNASRFVKVIVGAGAFGDGSWTDEAITNLLANTRRWISVVSTHNYGADIGADPNDGIFSEFNSHPHKTWMNYQASWATWPGGALWPIWNTESGTYGGISNFKGMNGLLQTKLGFPLWRPFSEESGRGELQQRQITSVVRILAEALRCKGYGFAKFFYYDSRIFNSASFAEQVLPYPASYTGVDNPSTFTLSVANYMVHTLFGPATNSAYPGYIEAYAGTNLNNQAVMVAWANDRTNKWITLDNSNYALLDESGNLEQTNVSSFLLTRVPKYLVSGTRTVAQLSNSFVSATVTIPGDTTGPKTSIDIAPSGLWSGATNAELIRWTSIDNTFTAWTTAPHSTNVVYKYKFNSGNHGPYSQSNYVWWSNIPAGNNTISVTSSDAAGNTTEVVYEFSPSTIGAVTGPPLKFGGRRLKVSR